ncbi:MAG: hypothetical protein ACXVJZ_14915 [Acidimicrobiia bacterium]
MAITVNYDDGFNANPAARAAFQAAVGIWRTQLTSSVPIAIDASFAPLASGVLGSAGPHTSVRTAGTVLPLVNHWYPIALANSILGYDADPADPDIEAQFSSAFPDWYFGTDGHPGVGQADFETVVLHELGHGLGFGGTMRVLGGLGSWGAGTGYPAVYDHFTTSNGTRLLNFTNYSAALASALQTTSVRFAGPNATTANGGVAPPLYAPNPWQQASSYAHLDEAAYPAGNPDSLMTPAIGPGESIHAPGPVALGLLKDLGWSLAADTRGGYVLDGFGGIHRFSIGASPRPPTVSRNPYWPGWDIARGIALLPNRTGGYVLDGFGGLHRFAVGSNPLPPAVTRNAYWPEWDVARGIALLPNGTGGYVVDGFGGLHRFAVGTSPLPLGTTNGPYWPGWNIARGIALRRDGTGGYVVDGFGGAHGFAVGSNNPLPPAVTQAPYWPGWDITRGIALS